MNYVATTMFGHILIPLPDCQQRCLPQSSQRQRSRSEKFKWLEAALNLVEIKNPFGSVQTNPQADAWWVPLFIFLKKCFFETP